MSLPELLTNRPQPVSSQTLIELAASFGIEGTLKELPSERDQNVLITRADNAQFLLKVKNPADPPGVAQFEAQMLLRLATNAPSLRIPRVVKTLQGATVLHVDTPAGFRAATMLTYVEGRPVAGLPASRSLRISVGATAAVLSSALRSIELRPVSRDMPWDFCRFLSLRALLEQCTDDDLRKQALLIFERWERSGIAHESHWSAAGLTPQLLHNDFNPHNLLVLESDTHRVSGVIDFGDVAYGPAIFDLAIASAYWFRHPDGLEAISEVAAGFHRYLPLTEAELAVFPLLIEARLLMTILITSWRASRNPQNRAYILRNEPIARAGLATLTTQDEAYVRAYVRHRLKEGLLE